MNPKIMNLEMHFHTLFWEDLPHLQVMYLAKLRTNTQQRTPPRTRRLHSCCRHADEWLLQAGTEAEPSDMETRMEGHTGITGGAEIALSEEKRNKIPR